jgi:DNA-binding NtrC family response regulator
MAHDVKEDVIRRLREAQGLAKLVGKAPAFRTAIAQLPAMARSGATVLITGETGTGKELVARALHYLSDRAQFPFVAINCGSLPDTLLEDALFGHERGAFTDATLRRPGLIAEGEHGTLFLDEVEALTPRAQVVLLRLLQDKTFRALGSCREQQANVRFLAATNAPLQQMVQAGTFRPDLYYRLCVFTINLPPLRDRREDIPVLAAHFLLKYLATSRPFVQLSPAAYAALLNFDWPGNVRELESAILRATQLCRTQSIEVADLGLPGERLAPPGPAPPPAAVQRPFRVLKKLATDAFEREYLIRLMGEHRGNVSHAARAAGKDRRELGRLLKKHGLGPKSSGPPAGPEAHVG